MNSKKHAKAVRRRTKLKARAAAEKITKIDPTWLRDGKPGFGFFEDYTQQQANTQFAAMSGRKEVTLEDIPEPTREVFRKEAERLLKEDGMRVRFWLRPDGQYSIMV